MSEKVLIRVINKITNELKRLSYDKRINDFDKNGDFYKFYFAEGTLRMTKYTIMYEANYVYVKELGLAYDEVILNGVRYSLDNCSIEVDTQLEKCAEEVYNFYKGLIISNIGLII